MKNTNTTMTAMKAAIATKTADEQAFYNTMLSFCFINPLFHENAVCNISVGNMNSRLDRATTEIEQQGERLYMIVSDYDSRSTIKLDIDKSEVLSASVNESDKELQADFVVLLDGVRYQFNVLWYDL